MCSKSYFRPIVVLFVISLIVSACVPIGAPVAVPVATPQDDAKAKALARELTQGDSVARANAVYKLGQLGAHAAPYLPELLAATQDPDPDVRTVAAFALGKIGASTEQSVRALLELITSPNEPLEVRYSATRALGKLGTPGAAGIATLRTLLAQDPDDNIRWAAVDALGDVGGAQDLEVRKVLVDALVDPSWYVANRASEILTTLGDEGVVFLTDDFMKNIRWDRRSAILATLARMPDAVAAPRLGAILTDETASVAEPTVLIAAGLSLMGQKGLDQLAATAQSDSPLAEHAFAALPQFGEQALPALDTIAQDTDKQVEAIKAMGAVGEPAIPRLIKFLHTASADPQMQTQMQMAILTALGNTATSPSTVISELLTISQDTKADRDVRSAALEALGAYGAKAEKDVPALQELLAKETGKTQAAAAGALGRVGRGRPDVINSLRAVLRQCDDTAIRAGQSLGQMGLLAQDSVPDLVGALACANPKAQAAAAEALGAIAPRSSTVIDALVEKLASADQSVAANAATALGRFGLAALPALVATLTDATAGDARKRAADALVNMGGVAAPGLIHALENPNSSELASDALSRIGRPALPFLVQDLREDDLAARQRILNTLYRIGAHAFEGFQWALQDPDLTVDQKQLDAIYDVAYTTNGPVVTKGIAVPEALPFLVASLPLSGTVEERKEAPRALGFVGPEAAPAIPLLAQMLDDSDPAYRCEVTLALLLIGPDDTGAAAPALAVALAEAKPDALCKVDSDIVRVLRTRQPAGYELLLGEILADPSKDTISPPLQHLLIHALTGSGPEADVAVPALVNTLKTPLANKSSTRRLAAEALGQVGAAAHPALRDLLRQDLSASTVPGLAEALAGLNNDLRRSAAYALLRSRAELNRPTMEALRAIAQDETEDHHVRVMAATALAAHGYQLAGLDPALDIVAPTAQMCPTWPEMTDLVASTGFDLYTDRCTYAKPPDAPRWKAVFRWLVKTWRGK